MSREPGLFRALPGDKPIFPRDPVEWIFRAFAVLLAITVHELSHAWSAYKLGDPTAKQMGRLSLNPIVHMDPIGTILLLLVGFGWAKPVPVNPLNFRHPGRDNALVSLAGPASNMVCAVVFGLALRPFIHAGNGAGTSALASSFQLLAFNIVIISLVLAVFNLIPIPPLDGSHILRELLPPSLRRGFDEFSNYGSFLLIAILILASFTGILGGILWPAVIFLFKLITGTW